MRNRRALLFDGGGTNLRGTEYEFKPDLGFQENLGRVVSITGVGERPYEELVFELIQQLGTDVSRIDVVVIAAAGDYDPATERIYLAHYLNGYIDIAAVKKRCGLENLQFVVLNDLEGEVPCIYTPGGKDVLVLKKGPDVWPPPAIAKKRRNVVVAPGTGVGVASIHGGDIITRTEGGNAELGTPSDAAQWAIWDRLRAELLKSGAQTLRAEGLFGGAGLQTLHFVLTGKRRSGPELGTLIRSNDAEVQETIRHWATAWGYYCQSVLLFFWPPASLTLSGVLRKDAPLVNNPHFLSAFNDFRSNAPALSQVEVRLLQGEHTVLWGCAWHAARELRNAGKL